ncbi:MAG TPA: RHS repeat-associated core domain-containing protein [Acidobacteriaceae bacterium]|nr:RHS repeat-associated core domain-containing protein [Acidobacteriaceae bacterium]
MSGGIAVNGLTAAGHWDTYFRDITIVQANGTVISLYKAGNQISLSPVPTGGATQISDVVEAGAPLGSSTEDAAYFLDDHLGSTQMELSSGGWPVWSGQFTPFGQEIVAGQVLSATLGNQQPGDGTNMHYKFTGKERDTESGNDYFGARYYASTMGRFMSPDWSAKAEPVPYAKLENPQSLNLYGYMLNNPLGGVDPDGHNGFTDWLEKVWNKVWGNGFRTNQEIADSHRAYLLEHMKDPHNQKAIDNIVHAPNAAVNQAYKCVTQGCALLNAIQIPTVGGKPFQTDQTGKIHTDIPDHVPENWSTQQLEDAKGELEESIKTRKDTLDYNEPDAPGHQTRLQNEQRFLDQVNEKLAGGK